MMAAGSRTLARAPRRGRCGYRGAAALAPAVGAALQPVGDAGRGDRGGKAACRWRPVRSSASSRPPSRSACRGPSGPPTCRARSGCRTEGKAACRRPPARPGRRCAHLRGHGRGLRPAPLRAGAAMSDVLIFARLPIRCERPYNGMSDLSKFTLHHGRGRHLHIRLLPLPVGEGAAFQKGVSFHEIDVSANRDKRKEMIERASGQSTYPQIFIGATHVGGCDDSMRRRGGQARCAACRNQGFAENTAP